MINKFQTEQVHISDIKVGDVVVIGGEAKTVGKLDIKEDAFMGKTLYGNSYKLGTQTIARAIIPKLSRQQ